MRRVSSIEGGGIEAVEEVEVQVIGLQALQAAFDFPHDVVTGIALVVGAGADRTSYFAGEEYVVPFALKGFRQDLLRVAMFVGIGRIDEVAAQVEGAFDGADADVIVFLAPEGGAQADGGDLDAGVS